MTSAPSILSIPGAAADHLYREGSAKASFWEVLFGSRLAPEKRTRVSSLPDGTRRFDVPTAAVEKEIFANARAWMSARGDDAGAREAAAALTANELRLSLVGLQPRGVAVASFQMRIEPAAGFVPAPSLPEAFQRWFAAERPRLLATLVPFGFTPEATSP